MINVTKPFLPPLEDYYQVIKGIYQRGWLTNNGPLVNELELKLKELLEIDHLLFLNNGTIALQLAIKSLDLTGEIITTPFSYVATTNSILWEGCTPVFVDINPDTLNIDPLKIEEAVTTKTSAILATHVYGNPCDIDIIQKIAKKHNLKVIYDAAHGFGTKYNGRSVFCYGDISITSFHATKIFHTIEGGAVFTQDPQLLRRLALMRNFGHDGSERFSDIGINGKNSEVHAGMGLCNLKYIESILAKRQLQCKVYDKWLLKSSLKKPLVAKEVDYNYSYYPIILASEELLLRTVQVLNDNWVYPRRYFYPSLDKLPFLSNVGECKISQDISRRVLCLPLSHDLSIEEQEMISRLILRTLNN